ncbi:MAG: EAL domain-containing protein [Dokdonella sp.]|uniref:EAL domain-containing protein n=1 Tax=Dokdonella sp. TaxID=2291710 RepID=UPI003267A6AF
MSESLSRERLPGLQHEILEDIARGKSLQSVAERLCIWVESNAPGVACTILTIDTVAGVLCPVAAPSLPAEYSQALAGCKIGPNTGSCGTAAWRGEPVETIEIATDPLWVDYRELILPHGFEACWSSPIKSGDGVVIGTFAFYYRTRRGPSNLERELVDKCVHLCAIAIEHERNQSRIHQLAYFDAVTGLPNRSHFNEHARALLAALAAGESANVLFVDLDDFKAINDTLGHHAGDLLLGRVAQRLIECATDRAFVAHLGGDEFALIQATSRARSDATELAGLIVAAFDAPFELDGRVVTIGASIGIAQAIDATIDLAELSRRADMALHVAKSEGRNAWRFFDAELETALQSRRTLKADLVKAIDNGDFVLAYQPIFMLSTRRVIGAEALLRWHHPSRGQVSPAEFIPIAEEMGLIGVLGEWALRQAACAAADWPRQIRIAVNLSPLQLVMPGLVRNVVKIIDECGLAPERLDLEVTESALLAENAATRIALYALRDVGMRISLDDFGTGYSSLRSLRSFPFDKIKIDQSFVADIGLNADATAIIRAIVALAHDLGIKTAAEGIETDVQLDWLCAAGCTEGQGYLMARPMPLEPLRALIDSQVGPRESVQ